MNPEQPLHWYTLKSNDSPDGLVSITSLPRYVLISKEGLILNNELPFPSSTGFSETVENLLKS